MSSTWQTGCQLAEELHEAGREVVLSCGRAPWAQRRPGGRDVILWLVDGCLLGAEDGRLHFASDLADSVAFGDRRHVELHRFILDHCVRAELA